MWFFTAMHSFMPGELIASAETLLAALTGKWFLRQTHKLQLRTQGEQEAASCSQSYQSSVFAQMSL